MKSRSHRYDINRPKLRSNKYKKCLNMILLIRIKQHLSNIWSLLHEKVAYKKTMYPTRDVQRTTEENYWKASK